MYKKIFKSDQVSIGVPVQIKVPYSFQTTGRIDVLSIDSKNDMEDESDKEQMVISKRSSVEEIVERAKEEAETIKKVAEIEAEKILEEAVVKAETIMVSIEEEAKNKGFEKGYSEAKSQYEDLLQEADYINERAKVEYKEMMERIEKDAVNVILDIARNVIGSELSINKESMLELVKQGFEKCSKKENVVVKVSSTDYDFMVDNKDRLLSMAEGIGKLDIVKDPSLKLGACIIETAYGSVDSGIDTKLKLIEEAFQKAL